MYSKYVHFTEKIIYKRKRLRYRPHLSQRKTLSETTGEASRVSFNVEAGAEPYDEKQSRSRGRKK